MNYSVETLIPHRAPMLLISRLITSTESHCICEADVDAQNIFAGEHGVPSWVGPELIAQTIAAYGGSQRTNNSKSKIGFLLGMRKFRSSVPYFKFGQTLSIHVEPIMVDEEVGTYFGKIYSSEDLIAEGTLTILKPSEQGLEKMRPE